MTSAIATDALVIGAGPVGLFQVFQLGLLGIQAHVVDALTHPGGQCVELYPDKPIYDIPAVAVCTGQELTNQLLAQIKPFNTQFHLGQEVSAVQRQQDGHIRVETSKGLRFLAKTVFIAAGVGAFQARQLKVEGVAAYSEGSNAQVLYAAPDYNTLTGQNVVVTGEDDRALDWAIALAQSTTRRVSLLHRRDGFSASPQRVERMRALCTAGSLHLVIGQITDLKNQAGRLIALEVTGTDAQTQALPLDTLLVSLGLSPRLGPLAHWGLDMARKQVQVNTETFATSVPGIFAVGDINTYPGKKKLIVCGFHECVLAAFGAAAIVFPDQPALLQYTTTSPKLHERLGVTTPVKA